MKCDIKCFINCIFDHALEVILYHLGVGQDGCAQLQRNNMPMCTAKETFPVIVISY